MLILRLRRKGGRCVVTAEDDRIAQAVTEAIQALDGKQVFLAFQEAMLQEVFPGEPPEDLLAHLAEVIRRGDVGSLSESVRGLEQRVKAVVGTAFFHNVLRRLHGRGPTN